jgi:hypothetical protein
MKEKKTIYESPLVEMILYSPEGVVCTVSDFNGFGSEDNWDNMGGLS